MASMGDGVGHLTSTDLVLKEGTSTATGDRCARKETWTPQELNE